MKCALTEEQSYVLGLLVGGGTLSSTAFSITLPLDKWGANPHNMRIIASDILTKMQNTFTKAYGIKVNYELLNKGNWRVHPEGPYDLSAIVSDLKYLRLPTTGQLIDEADLSYAKSVLSGLKAEKFLSGIFDARASLTKSHRRFFDEAPVVSIEVPGSTQNFKFVVQLCCWLTDMQSVTDQILFNHPNQHSASDPTYTSWRKGFKIRFLAKSFITKHCFNMKAKAISAIKLVARQNVKQQPPCEVRNCRAGTISIHKEIGSPDLPYEVRNKIFLHYHHICAAMSCPHAPYDNVREMVCDSFQHISVLPLLSKGNYDEMDVLHKDIMLKYFSDYERYKVKMKCSVFLERYEDFYSESRTGIAYLFSEKLKGKRHLGPQEKIIKNSLNDYMDLKMIPGTDYAPIFLGTPLNNRGIIISSVKGFANQKLLREMIKIKGIDIDVISKK